MILLLFQKEIMKYNYIREFKLKCLRKIRSTLNQLTKIIDTKIAAREYDLMWNNPLKGFGNRKVESLKEVFIKSVNFSKEYNKKRFVREQLFRVNNEK